MTVTLTLAPEYERKLAERAAALGKDPAGYLQQLVEKDMEQATFAELFAPVHRAVKDSGITPDAGCASGKCAGGVPPTPAHWMKDHAGTRGVRLHALSAGRHE